MEEIKSNNLVKKVIIGSLIVAGALSLGDRMCSRDIKEVTSTYQGYSVEGGNTLLVFDDQPKNTRTGFPELVINGNPDTLEIGKQYTLKYSQPAYNSSSPYRKKILNIK